MDISSKVMQETISRINSSKTYILDTSKIKTLDDVVKVLDGLEFKITLMEGTTSIQYEKLKDYLK